MIDILEIINPSETYKVGDGVRTGEDVKHLLANGMRYEELKKSIGGTQ